MPPLLAISCLGAFQTPVFKPVAGLVIAGVRKPAQKRPFEALRSSHGIATIDNASERSSPGSARRRITGDVRASEVASDHFGGRRNAPTPGYGGPGSRCRRRPALFQISCMSHSRSKSLVKDSRTARIWDKVNQCGSDRAGEASVDISAWLHSLGMRRYEPPWLLVATRFATRLRRTGRN